MTTPAKPAVMTDPVVRRAMGTFVTRSERAEDLDRLVATFVDSGIVDLVHNTKNQIIYGRRGTGKTHLMRFLEARFRKEPATVATYIDARTLGSSTLFADTERPLHSRFLGLYRDVIATLHNALFEELAAKQAGKVDAALDALGEIEKQLAYTESEIEDVRIRSAETNSRQLGTSVRASVAPAGPSLSAGVNAGMSASVQSEMESRTVRSSKVIFPTLFAGFQKVLDDMHLERFVILVDEWSSIPLDLQPYLAELLNRVFFANRKVVVKIATLEFRSKFVLFDSDGRKELGLELGGDIESAIDLDDFYVYDRDPGGTETLYADLLHRHLVAALEQEGYLVARYGVTSSSDLVRVFFTEQAFKELARTAEGVARDLLQVFARAYTRASKADAAHITVPAVTTAARDWYESDKQSNLSEEQHELLRALVEEVIGTHNARSFLVAREDSTAPLLRSLIDQRVVHVIRKGYADKDNPGIRYNIYTLDYGCYVDLKGTKREPRFEIAAAEGSQAAEAPVVPFDDNRSIRRIIVPRRLLVAKRDG